MSRAQWLQVHGYSADSSQEHVCRAATASDPLQKCISFAPSGVMIGGCEPSYVVYVFFRDRLATILVSVPEDCFKSVADVLRSEYGRPVSETSQAMADVQGKTLSGRIINWSNGVSDIDLTQFEDNTVTSSILYSHNDLQIQVAAFVKKRDRK